jgi:hypothetical protein
VLEIEEVLRECGVTDASLTREERDRLEGEGYLLFPGLAAGTWLEDLQAGLDRATAEREGGTRHVGDLIGAGGAFDRLYQHPKVLAAVHQVLRRSFRVAQLHGREPLAGFGQQGLHADARPRSASEPFSIVTTIWMLDDFTPDNGATRIVPRSHLSLNPPPKALADPGAHHKDELVVTGSAGTVLLFNGHLWHSGTKNRSGGRRRAVQLLFSAYDAAWHVGIPENVPPGLADRARFLLGCRPSSIT